MVPGEGKAGSVSQDVLVSVVIPSFNTPREKLRSTLHSVLRQTEKRIEVLVIDDGSDIPFAGLGSEFAGSGIDFIQNNENLGVARTRNRGIERARGRYVGLLDSGDRWMERKLEKQLSKMHAEKDLAMVFCGVRINAYGIVHYDKLPLPRDDWYTALLETMPITGSSSAVLIKTEILRELGGFYTQDDIPEDRELWLRIAKRWPIGFVNEVLAEIEVSMDSRSGDPGKKEVTYKRFIKMHENEMRRCGVYRKTLSNYHAGLAHKYFLHGHMRKGFHHSFASLVYNYRRYVALRVVYFLRSRTTENPYLDQVARSKHVF